MSREGSKERNRRRAEQARARGEQVQESTDRTTPPPRGKKLRHWQKWDEFVQGKGEAPADQPRA